MYSLTVPIMMSSVTRENRADFLMLLKRAEADRLFIATHDEEDPDICNKKLEDLRDNIAYFKENGLDVAIWLGRTIGHGSTLINSKDPGIKPKFQRIVDLQGQELYNTNCPYDKSLQEHLGEVVGRYADLGADFLILDDDFRLSQHSNDFCCACDLHMEKIREYCGEDITREELKRLAFSGGKNKYRDAWMKAQGESLRSLARAIRAGVDKVNPDFPVGTCSAYCSWDLDGADPIEITDILAGKNKKVLRLHGAPYWVITSNKTVEGICEMERMFSSFLKDRPDIEIISEGDTYPRPRSNVPASYLEIMDGALRADKSFDGILKYMIDYGSQPLKEQGYINRHAYDLPKLRGIESLFESGANAGVRVYICPHLIQDADLSVSPALQQSPYPTAGIILSMCGIPTVYRGDGMCSALFGENARHFGEEAYSNGAILDAVSAKILTEKGVDVGISSVGEFTDGRFGSIESKLSGIGETVLKGFARFLMGNYKKEIRQALTVNINGKEQPFAYCYENADGQRFFVFTFVADALASNPIFFRCYEVQSALQSMIPWVSKRSLPAYVEKEVEVYTLCEKGDCHTSVALFNCYADHLINITVRLDKTYSNLECVGCKGHIEGKNVIIDTPISAFDFAAFKAFDKLN